MNVLLLVLSCCGDGGIVGPGTWGGGGTGGSGGAPTSATYLTQTPNATLSAEQAMSLLGTGLVKNTTTTGVQSIYAGTSCTNQFPRSLNASGAATCATVTLGTDTNTAMTYLSLGALDGGMEWMTDYQGVRVVADAGYFANLTCTTLTGGAGGSNPQVQYNNAGSFGGMSMVESSGGQLSLVPTASHPSVITDRALITAFVLDGGWPIVPMVEDPNTGVPMPIGWQASGTLTPSMGAQEVWSANCHFPDGWGTTTWANPAQSANGMVASGSQSGFAFDAGTWWGQQRWDSQVTTTGGNIAAGAHMQSKTSIRGAVAHAGGFEWWGRVTFRLVSTPMRAFFGLTPSTSSWGALEPSNFTHSVYFGADPQVSNWNICSDDGTVPATCSDLGSSFAIASNTTWDLWLFAPPHGSYVDYFIQRLPDPDDTAHASVQTAGRITSDLPGNMELMATRLEINSGDAGTNPALSIGPSCTWDNW